MSTTRTRILPRALAAAAALTLGTAAALAGATTANAVVDTIEVTVATGSGAGTLADAIVAANADADPSTITFSPSVVSGGTITVDDNGLPEIYPGSVTIEGPTSGTLVIQAHDGNDQGFRAWGYSGDAPEYSVSISNLTISGFNNNVQLGFVEATLDQLVLVGGTSNSLLVANTAFTGTDITVEGAGTNGVYVLDIDGDPTPVSFDGLTVSGHADGLTYVGENDATASFTNVTSVATQHYGIRFDLYSGAHVDLSRADATGPWNGLNVYANEASASVTGSDFHDAGFSGVHVEAHDGSEVELIDSQIYDNNGNSGGGLEAYIYDSTLGISGTVIRNNEAVGDGGGIAISDLQGADAWVRIVRSTITNNSANGVGGGIALNNIGDGGTGSGGVNIADSEITANEAQDGGGLSVNRPGLYASDNDYPSVFVERTTLADNEATDNGGGAALEVYGPGTYGPVAFVNSTFSGNTAGVHGGAGYVDAGADFMAYFNSTTIAGNSSGIFAASSLSTVGILYSILANNGTNDLERDHSTLDVNWSLIESSEGTDATADVAAGTGNIVGVDPELGALANNGGNTRTMRPANTSPAVNAGDPSLVTGALPDGGDQRGGSRLVNYLDLGAVELTTLELGTAALAATGTSPIVPAGAVLLLLVGGIALVAVRKRVRA